MLRTVIVLSVLGIIKQACGDSTENDDWRKKGFYRPRRNFPSQTQYDSQLNQAFDPKEPTPDYAILGNAFGVNQNYQQHNSFGIRSRQPQYSFGQNLPRTGFSQNQRSNAFGSSFPQNQQTDNARQFGFSNQNAFRRKFSETGQGLVTEDNDQYSFRGFGHNHQQNNFDNFNENAFGSFGQKIQNQNSFGSIQNQNTFSKFGSLGFENQNYQAPGYLPPKPYQGPEYLPPDPTTRRPFTTTTKRTFFTTTRPFYTTTTTKRPFYTTTTRRTFYTTSTTRRPTTTTRRFITTPTTRKPIFTTKPTTTTIKPTPDDGEVVPDRRKKPPTGAVAPAMAMVVPPEPDDDGDENFPDTIVPDRRKNPPTSAVAPAMAMVVPPEPDDDGDEDFPDNRTPPPREGAVAPAMAMIVPPEPDDDGDEIIPDFRMTTKQTTPTTIITTPTTTIRTTPSTTTSTTPSTTTSTTPSTTTSTTTVRTTPSTTTPSTTTSTTPSTTTSTTPSTTTSTTTSTTPSTTTSTTTSTTPSTTTSTTTSTTPSTTTSTTTTTTPSTTTSTTTSTTPSTTTSTTTTTPSTTTTTPSTTTSTTTSTTPSTTTTSTTISTTRSTTSSTTPSTTTSTTTPRTTTTPITTTRTTPDLNRNLEEESSPTEATSTTLIPVTNTTTQTPYIGPGYLPPDTTTTKKPPETKCDPLDPRTWPTEYEQQKFGELPCAPSNPSKIPPTPAPARGEKVPEEPKCDPLDPSTWPSEEDQRVFGEKSCAPISSTITSTTTTTTTTPSTTTSTTPSTTTSTTTTTTPSTTTTTPSTTTSTTPSTTTSTTTTPSTTTSTTTTTPSTTSTTPSTTQRINIYIYHKCLPPDNKTVHSLPPSPASAEPVPPEPECDPLDSKTWPSEIDQLKYGEKPCAPKGTTTETPFTGYSYLPPKPQECIPKTRRKRSSEDTLRLKDIKGTPRPVWYSGIYRKITDPYYPICGGSIVKEDVVISAAHCFWDDVVGLQPAEQFAVAASKIYKPWNDPMDKKAQKSDVLDIKIPARFLGAKTSFQEDIAILKLATPFRYTKSVKPICVDFEDNFDRMQMKAGHYGTIAGWGLTDSKGTPTQRLLWLELPYIEIEKCIKDSEDAFLKYITCDKVCAGENDTGKALCRGDSGGGLAFWIGPPEHATPYLRGIASTAPSPHNAECNVYAYGSFTHIRSHRTFLRDHVPHIGECQFWQ